MAVTPSQYKANQKYIKEHYDNLQIRVPKEDKERYKKAAADVGTSFRQFVIDAIEEHIEKTRSE